MAIIPTQNQYPDRAGYLGLDTDRNVLVGMSDGILQDMTNTVPEGWVNVKDFGAKGDGVTDDTQAIQTAIDNGNIIYFPPGTYMISNTLHINKSNQMLLGCGQQLSIIKINTNIGIEINQKRYITIHNLHLSFSSYTTNNIGINLITVGPYLDIKNVRITYSHIGIQLNTCWICNIINVYFIHTYLGIKTIGANTNFFINNIVIDNGNALLDLFGVENGFINNIGADWLNYGLNAPYSFKEFLPENAIDTITLHACRALTINNIGLENSNISNLIRVKSGSDKVIVNQIKLSHVENLTNNNKKYLFYTSTEYAPFRINSLHLNQCFTNSTLSALLYFGYASTTYGSKPEKFPYIIFGNDVEVDNYCSNKYYDSVASSNNAPLAIQHKYNNIISRLNEIDLSSLTPAQQYNNIFFKQTIDENGNINYTPITYYHF